MDARGVDARGVGCEGKGCMRVAAGRVFSAALLSASQGRITVCGRGGLEGCVRGWATMTLHPARHLFISAGHILIQKGCDC